jgi:hypothetical protein
MPMNKTGRGRFNVALLGLLFTIATAWVAPINASTHSHLEPFRAVYDMYRQGDRLGSGKRELTFNNDGEYSLLLQSKLKWLIFSDKRFEKTNFTIKSGKVKPIDYYYKRSGTGNDDKIKIEFQKSGTLSVVPKNSKKSAPDEWQEGWQDEMSLHAQIQLDLKNGATLFEYDVVTNSGQLRNYKFEVIGEELISTGLGRFKAIKVARIYENKKFYAQHAWFIADMDYTLARLWRMKKGVEQYDLVIKSYTPLKVTQLPVSPDA